MTAERAYMPHIWIHQTGFGPKVWAGEVTDSRRPLAPVRFARLDKAGFHELTAQLQADIKTLTGAA